MPKTIWYLHHYAGAPSLGMSYRPYYLSKEFNKNGYKAFVIAASFHHLLQKAQDQREPLKNEVVDGVPYLWLKTTRYSKNGLSRMINMFQYAWMIKQYVKQIISITGKPDIIIASSSHPIHFLSAHQKNIMLN